MIRLLRMRVHVRTVVIGCYIFVCCYLTIVSYQRSILDRSPNSDTAETDHLLRQFWSRFALKQTNEEVERTVDPPAIEVWPERDNTTDRIIAQMNFIPRLMRNRTFKVFVPSIGVWGLGRGATEFEGCLSARNCLVTSGGVQEADAADAIVFRQSMSGLPANFIRPSGQIWVLQILESPPHTVSFANHANAVNWTATYRWDSDIVTPYERFTPYSQVPPDQLRRPTPLTEATIRNKNYAKGKTKMVAWFVSHCQTYSKREVYASMLSRFGVQVDIYGSCGKLRCSRGSKACSDLLNKEYRFYLSFENSLCRDYVTEKYFVNGLTHDIVPIVMGPSRDYYTRISPPHSFIHVDDFASPAALATYLQYLAVNETAYNEYLAWKDPQLGAAGQLINTKFWCRLCALLNDPRPRVYADLEGWWRPPGVCRMPYWTAGNLERRRSSSR